MNRTDRTNIRRAMVPLLAHIDDDTPTIDRPMSKAEIEELIMQYPCHSVEEYCSNCEDFVTIPRYGISRCPTCGEGILPCDYCMVKGEDGLLTHTCHGVCPYEEE